MEIEDLVLAVQRGDSRAWRELSTRLGTELRPFFRQWFGEADASDLIQNTLMVVHRKLPEFELRPGKPFRHWVGAIARIEANEARRQRGAEQRLAAAARLAAAWRVPSANPSSRLDRARDRARLAHALAKLRTHYRLVIEHDLAEGDDCTFAQRAGIERGSVRTRRRRAYALLRRLVRKSKRRSGGRDTTPRSPDPSAPKS